MKTREESPQLKEAKQHLTNAVISLLAVKGSVYRDIEESVEDAFVIAENKYLWCDIHAE